MKYIHVDDTVHDTVHYIFHAPNILCMYVMVMQTTLLLKDQFHIFAQA